VIDVPSVGRDDIAGLGARVHRQPADRYPIQHATAQFHLGAALARAERLDEAETALRASAEGFSRAGLTTEAAKAANQLGAVLRLSGRPEPAVAILEAAAEAFGVVGHAAEEGAASLNLGLARRDCGDSGAYEAFRVARRRLEEADLLEPASHAAREAGAEIWAVDPDRAADELAEAVALARRAGATAAEGAAANVLGLVHLGEGRLPAALAALTDSVAAHPRSIRPADHAMAQANLALVHEQAREVVRARWAARHALGVAEAPEPVRAQATAVMARLGNPPGDLGRLLDEVPQDTWATLVRVELTRLAAASPGERRAETEGWVRHQLARREHGEELAATWLGALLELEPEAVDSLVAELLDAVRKHPEEETARLRAQLERAMARFHVPQMMRLSETFERSRSRDEPAWR
jgi:tetratricopeptide (TPR) repeat protein